MCSPLVSSHSQAPVSLIPRQSACCHLVRTAPGPTALPEWVEGTCRSHPAGDCIDLWARLRCAVAHGFQWS